MFTSEPLPKTQRKLDAKYCMIPIMKTGTKTDAKMSLGCIRKIGPTHGYS